MNRGIRSYALAVGMAAVLSGQAVAAAPQYRAARIDPLVALSVFGTAQSQAAVCAPGTSAAVAGAAAAAQGQAPGCVLPVTAPPVAAVPPPAYVAPVAAPATLGTLPILLGLAAIVAAIAALAASGGGKGSGDLTPISPA